MSGMARSIAAPAAAVFLLAGLLCPGGEIASDSGVPPEQDLSGRQLSLEDGSLSKAHAMELFSEAFLKAASSRGVLDAKGMELLFQAVELDPDSPELIRELVSGLLKNKSMERSLNRLRDLALRHPGSPALVNLVSDVMEGEGRRPDAVKVLSAAFEKAREDGFAEASELKGLISKLALLQAISGDAAEASKTVALAMKSPELASSMQLLQAALAVDALELQKADATRPWWGLGLVESDAEACKARLENRCDAFTKAALESREPFNAALYQTAIGTLKLQGRLEDARKILLNGLLGNPDDKETLATLARVSYDLKEPSNACRYWEQALRRGLKPSPVVYASYALALREAGRLEEAARVYEWQLLLDPGNKASALQLALSYLELGKIEKCLARLDAFDNEYSAMYLKAVCLDRLKRRSEALDALLKSEALAQGDELRVIAERNYRLLRASFAEKARRPDIVKSSIQPLLDRNADDYEALNFLGYTLADMNKDLELSERCVRKAVEGDPSNAAYLDSMAWVLYRKGAFKEAAAWMDKALAACSGEPDGVLLDHAGDIRAALGDSAGALKLWNEALAAAPDEELDPSRVKAKIEALSSKGPSAGAKGE